MSDDASDPDLPGLIALDGPLVFSDLAARLCNVSKCKQSRSSGTKDKSSRPAVPEVARRDSLAEIKISRQPCTKSVSHLFRNGSGRRFAVEQFRENRDLSKLAEPIFPIVQQKPNAKHL